MSFAVFLDVDGVLNSRTTCEWTPDYQVGIDDLRVAVLARAIKKYGPTEIVLSSDWKELRPEADDYEWSEDNEYKIKEDYIKAGKLFLEIMGYCFRNSVAVRRCKCV